MTEHSVDVSLVLTTVPDPETGERIVRQLVEERLVACGSLLPGMTSIFRWQGAVQREGEVLVLLKTRAGAVERLFRRVPEIHPYEVPELLALPVAVGHPPYCGWVVGETAEVGA